jgi:heterodisulfide reductase subunit A
MSVHEEPRIGVFVCHCGHNIAGVVNVTKVAEEAGTMQNVCFSTHEMFMCSDAGQELIKNKIKEYNLNRVVVASCSPRMHEQTFRKVVEEVGLNRYLFEQVNLREHVSWCHMREPELATKKAIDLVRMSVARAARLQSLPVKLVSVNPTALVVGGGIAGLTSALDIADRGFDVILVERQSSLGGHLVNWTHLFPTGESGSEVIYPLIHRVTNQPRIKIMLNCEVVEFEGYVGNFVATVMNNNTSTMTELQVGTVVIATGFEVFKPYGYFCYGESPDIVTLAELQKMEGMPTLVKPSNGKPIKKVAFIGCVGSREVGNPGHEHCSRHCCFVTSKAASDLKDKMDEVLILYKSLRTYGKHHETIHRLAREKHVIYSRFPVDDNPIVKVKQGKIIVKWRDIFIDEMLTFDPDLLVLASAMIAPHDADLVAKLFGLTRSSDGFFNPEHIKLAPLTTHTAGVMIAGTSQAAKNASESAIDASGAAAKAAAIMARGEIQIESTIAHVKEEVCSSCYTCIDICPYHAIEMAPFEAGEIAKITDAKCHGCGSCAAACPSNAIEMMHSTDDQIMSMIEAYLVPYANARGGA